MILHSDGPSEQADQSVKSGFHPESLEKAAKAARELDIFRNAQQAIELIKTQELTQQHAHAAKRAEMDAYTEQ